MSETDRPRSPFDLDGPARTRASRARSLRIELQWRCYDSSIGGASERALATQLNLSPATVHRYIERCREEHRQRGMAAAEKTKIDLIAANRLVLQGVMPAAMRGDVGSARTARQVLAEIAKLSGAYEPELINVSMAIMEDARKLGLNFEDIYGEVNEILSDYRK